MANAPMQHCVHPGDRPATFRSGGSRRQEPHRRSESVSDLRKLESARPLYEDSAEIRWDLGHPAGVGRKRKHSSRLSISALCVLVYCARSRGRGRPRHTFINYRIDLYDGIFALDYPCRMLDIVCASSAELQKTAKRFCLVLPTNGFPSGHLTESSTTFKTANVQRQPSGGWRIQISITQRGQDGIGQEIHG